MNQLELPVFGVCQACEKETQLVSETTRLCIKCFNRIYPPDYSHARYDFEDRDEPYPYPRYGNFRDGDW